MLHTLVTAVLIVQTAGEALRGGRGSSSQGATVAASVMAKPGGAKPRRALKASAAARRIRSIRVAEHVRRKNLKEDKLIARASRCGSFRVFNKWHAVIAGLQILI